MHNLFLKTGIYRLIVLLWLFVVFFLSGLFATHNLAGQLIARRVSGTTYELTLTTYTDPAPAGVDRCSADIEIWSTGATPSLIRLLSNIPRSNGDIDLRPVGDCKLKGTRRGVEIYATVKKNVYQVMYTFPGPGSYEIRYYDVARREDVDNISRPGEQAFYVETLLAIPNPIIGYNNTPVLLNTPLDEACIGKFWSHNPGGFDPDGDSLVYYLRPSYQYDPPRGVPPQPATGYLYPDHPRFKNGPLIMDRNTGLMTWETPMEEGVYNIAYVVEEWRNGRRLGYVIRDMVIFVKKCTNDPPRIISIMDTCIQAGKTLKFDFIAYDPNPTDSLYLRLNSEGLGNNGPFSVGNKPSIYGVIKDSNKGDIPFQDLPVSAENRLIRYPDSVFLIDTIQGTFEWETNCGNIRRQFYQVDFFAHDNISYIGKINNTLLSDNHLVAIRIVPPAPQNLKAVKSVGKIDLSWEPPYCNQILGYRVYRKRGEAGAEPDTLCCSEKPTRLGYKYLGFVIAGDSLRYTDSLADEPWNQNPAFCYLVTAIYPDASNPSIEANVESCPSNNACVEITLGNVYMTNDSVALTDAIGGIIYVGWSTPKGIDVFFGEELSYQLYRSDGMNARKRIADRLAAVDTVFFDTNLDTKNKAYTYTVTLVKPQGIPVSLADTNVLIAQSIFLKVYGKANGLYLNWRVRVPWVNTRYLIYRAQAGGAFDLLDSVSANPGVNHYTDTNVIDGTEYCYFIRAIGAYSPPVAHIKQILINDSEQDCDKAIDQAAPCFPRVKLSGDCNLAEMRLLLGKNLDPCDEDGAEMVLFYASDSTGVFAPIDTLAYASFTIDTTLLLSPSDQRYRRGGCFRFQTRDLSGNTSALSEPYCWKACPGLHLGNMFSPNDDGINDYFTPIAHEAVKLISFQVYDRWGKLLHRNDDNLDKLWDGGYQGKKLESGVYYYLIIYELGGETIEKKGWLQLLK